MTLSGVGEDLYAAFKPLLPFIFTFIFVVIVFQLSHKAFLQLVREITRELKEFAELRISTRSINFTGLIALVIFTAIMVWRNPFNLVIPEQFREPQSYYADGIACFLISLLVVYTLLCTAIWLRLCAPDESLPRGCRSSRHDVLGLAAGER